MKDQDQTQKIQEVQEVKVELSNDELYKQFRDENTAKAEIIGKGLNLKVTPLFAQKQNGEFAVVFIKEPNRLMKMSVMQKIMDSQIISAGDDILTGCAIKEETIPSNALDDDDFFISFCASSVSVVKIATPHIEEIQKKS